MAAELADVAADLRATGESIADDPERLEVLRSRRQLLHDLRRKYGETLADVLGYAGDVAARLAELEQHDRRAAELDAAGAAADAEVARLAGEVAERRRAAAPDLASRVEGHLTALAMPGDREQCLQAGANAYLSKPVSLKDLVRVIQAQLNQDQIEKEI